MGGGGQTLEPQLAVEPTTPIRKEMRMPPEVAGKKHPLLSSIFGRAIPLVDESMLAVRFHPKCASLWRFCGKRIHSLFINNASPSPLFLIADILLLDYLLMTGVVYDVCSFCGHVPPTQLGATDKCNGKCAPTQKVEAPQNPPSLAHHGSVHVCR